MFANGVVGRNTRLVAECCQNFISGIRAVQRSDKWLDDAYRSIESPDIPPGLQIMRLRDVPLAILRRLIKMGPDMKRAVNSLELRNEIEIVRRIVNGIPTKYQERID